MIMRAREATRALAAVAVGVAVMGADPAPVTAPKETQLAAANAAVDKAFPTPRLYKVTITGSMPNPLDGVSMCLGADLLRKIVGVSVKYPEAAAALTKGCTEARETHEDGSLRVEIKCDKAAGAMMTSRTVVEGTVKDMRRHTEIEMDLGAAGAPKTMSTDWHMVDAGECPANMKPGQLRNANGEISDPLAELAKMTSEAKTDAGAGK
jgi:hypothetical protein